MSRFTRSTTTSLKPQNDDDNSPQTGVKQDLSEITRTITRQFWGVASLIAPPVSSGGSNERSEGMRRDFAEIGGRVRSEISKFASEFLRVDSDDDSSDDVAVGVTDEVVAFVNDIAMHPETWLGFPLPEDEDFDLSDAQEEHVLAVEQLAPRLNALRIQLCPNYMSESCFWKIYFVLLHPRLKCNDAETLSTPCIVKARALLTHELNTRCSINTSDCNSKSLPLDVSATETLKHPININDIQIVDKSVIQEESQEDDWLKEASTEIIIINRVAIPIENNEDVSFSDDDDDDGNIPIHYKKTTNTSESSNKRFKKLG